MAHLRKARQTSVILGPHPTAHGLTFSCRRTLDEHDVLDTMCTVMSPFVNITLSGSGLVWYDAAWASRSTLTSLVSWATSALHNIRVPSGRQQI